MKRQDALTGYSLLLMVVLALLSSLGGWSMLAALAGCFAWFAASRLFGRLSRLQQGQVLVMLLMGLAGLGWGQLRGAGATWWWQALEANQGLLAMLVAVSFLRLVAVPDLATGDALPIGRKALWKTLLGVHAFGAVINFSAMVIMGDRLSARQPLTPLQALIISRGFSLGAHWSPFFAAMGVVLISVPQANLWTLMLFGLLPASVGLLLAGWWLLQRPEAETTPAYPMHWQGLLLPLLLAASVLIGHAIWPDLSVLTLVSLVGLLFTLVLVFWRYRQRGWSRLRQHIEGLSVMSGETLLFLAAGVLAAGLGAALQAMDFSFRLDYFGPWQAWFLLLAMVGVSGLSVHPVISISTVGGLFSPWVADPNLLALVFLMTWSQGVMLSPLSGTHLVMQGRYGLPSHAFTRWNFRYVLLLLLVDLVVLHLYAAFSHH